MTNIVEGSLGQLVNIVTRQKELAEQAANGVYSSAQRLALNKEANALVKEYNRIVQSTQFNNSRILDGTDDSIQIQHGSGLAESTLVNIGQQVGYAAGDGTFGLGVAYTNGTYITGSIQFVDVDSDGVLDAVSSDYGGEKINIARGNGNGTFRAAVSYVNNLDYGSYTSSDTEVATGDFNGDGIADVVTSVGLLNQFFVSLGNGNGSFKLAVSYDIPDQVGSIYTADFNGDGYDDMIRADSGYTFALVHLANSNGTFKAGVTMFNGGSNVSQFGFGDVNSDGIVDMVTGGGTTSSLLIGNGNGTFRHVSSRATLGSTESNTVDLNGDGFLDILSVGSTRAYSYIGNGDGTFRAGVSYAFGTAFGSAVVGDFNGDGTVDFAVGDNMNSHYTFAGNGDGSFRAAVSSGFAIGPFPTLNAADFNNDGILDLSSISGTATSFFVSLGDSDASGRRNNYQYSMDLTTARGARAALVSTTERLRKISLEQGAIGAFQSRLSTSLNNLSNQVLNIQDARSRITDADVALDAAALTKAKILQQASAAILAQANQAPTLALRLLNSSD